MIWLLACVFVTKDERHDRLCGAADADGDGACDVDDCAPDDPLRSPGFVEACNGIDDDCDGAVDDGLFADDDGDSWGVASDGPCFASWVTRDGDCDDGDAYAYPGAVERCDGKRDDCDDAGWVGDDGLVTYEAETGPTTLAPRKGETLPLSLPSFGEVTFCAPAGGEPLPLILDVPEVDGELWLVGISADGSPVPIDAYGDGTVLTVETAGTGRVYATGLAFQGGGRGDGLDGGGIRVASGGELTLEGCEVRENFGTFGGIYSEGYLELHDVVVEANGVEWLGVAEDVWGGGVTTSGTLLALDSSILDNESGGDGGGLYVEGGIAVLNGVTISGNVAQEGGGGAYLGAGADVRMVGSAIVDNVVPDGGIHGGGGALVKCGLTCDADSEVSRNVGPVAGGIDIVEDGVVWANGCAVTGNTLPDGTPSDVLASGETWSFAAGTCFVCDDGGGCGEAACP